MGGGGHCRSAIDVLEACALPVAGVVHGEACARNAVLGYPALGADIDLPRLRKSYSYALVTVGQIKSAQVRIDLYNALVALNFTLPVVMSPRAHVSRHAAVNAGTIVMHDAFVNSGAQVGENCIINTKALIEHDCTIGKHCHVAIGAVLCGNVHVGGGCFIGAGAVVKQGVRIGANALIGMGCVVRHDVPEGSVYVGFDESHNYR